jgi:hypothetical protein
MAQETWSRFSQSIGDFGVAYSVNIDDVKNICANWIVENACC